MGHLKALHDEQDQSPWLDNLKRGWITSGDLQRWLDRGVRGITSNPTIFQKAIESGSEYDDEFRLLIGAGTSVQDSYWKLVTGDIEEALRLLRPTYDSSEGIDGYVSVEVAPSLAHDTEGTKDAARHLSDLIDEPNLYVKIPGTVEGLPAIQTMISEKRSINVTLLFGLDRYAAVMEAYIAGLEGAAGDLSAISSVASFFVSRVDTEIDQRLDTIGTDEAAALKGKAAVANARLAYELFLDTFKGDRWDALVARGARVQRPLWASTSTKNPAYPDTLYVDDLIGPHTVNTIPDATLAAFDDHGTVARTLDTDFAEAHATMAALKAVGVDIDDVTKTLEDEGVASFAKSFDELIGSLQAKAQTFG